MLRLPDALRAARRPMKGESSEKSSLGTATGDCRSSGREDSTRVRNCNDESICNTSEAASVGELELIRVDPGDRGTRTSGNTVADPETAPLSIKKWLRSESDDNGNVSHDEPTKYASDSRKKSGLNMSAASSLVKKAGSLDTVVAT